jgi:acetyl/propionyl-CoA carboxylase alpha subunit/acetyl-CoA carboxylase carboxyltransferase component
VQCPFTRIAIANRGEAAMRLIHAVHELKGEQESPIAAVALFADPDRYSMYVRQADDAVSLGSPTFVDADGRVTSSYLDYERLERVLLAAEPDAVWVGWGSGSGHVELAELCERLHLVFVGPDVRALHLLGEQASAKRFAESAGLPVASLDSATLDSLPPGWRHIEVQVIADHYGTVWAVGVRDCTIRRGGRIVMAESRSSALTDEQERDLRHTAADLCRLAGYSSTGTVEFLYDTVARAFSFLRVGVGLQVEHPVTEQTSGLDLVKLQLYVAGGGRLQGEPPPSLGHSVTVRLWAEDAAAEFAPSPGTIELLRLPTGPGVRVDAGISEGDTIPASDSTIASITTYGHDRREALGRLASALTETEVVVRGGSTNQAFLLFVAGRPEVASGDVDVSWLDRLVLTDAHLPRQHRGVALLVAAVEVYQDELAAEMAQFFSLAARGRAEASASVGQVANLRCDGLDYRFRVHRLGPTTYRVLGAGREIDLRVERTGRFDRRVSLGGRTYRVLSVLHGDRHLIDVDGVGHQVTRSSGSMVRAPVPAVVLAVLAKEGDEVATGDRLALLEAMKTEISIVAPSSGTVTRLFVTPNVQVAASAPLMELQSAAPEDSRSAREPVDLSPYAVGGREQGPQARSYEALDALYWEMLGFDVDPGHSRQLVGWYATAARELAPDDEALLRREDLALNAFADLSSLARTRPDPQGYPGGQSHSSHEDLLTYLRAIERRGADLAPPFVEGLRHCLGHFGVQSLDPTPELREALFWIAKAQRRVGDHVPAISSILDRRLEQIESISFELEDGFRSILDRLISATHQRFPDLAHQAREVRYQYFELPEFAARAALAYADASEALLALEGDLSGTERDERMAELIDCPQPLKNYLAQQFESAGTPRRRIMLEALTRRYYRTRGLGAFRFDTGDGTEFAVASYEHQRTRLQLVALFARYDDLARAMDATVHLLGDAGGDSDVIVDFYVWRQERSESDDATAQELNALIARVAFPPRVRRLVVAISSPGQGLGMAGIQHFTFGQASTGGYREDPLYRGLHPMMGERLHLQQLSEFRLTRLPSAEDVYLFSGIAKDNPADERLFALAEVRDVTPIWHEGGREVQLLGLERQLNQALAGIRAHYSARPPQRRLHMNRVVLYVWPMLELTVSRLHDFVHRLAPNVEGLGVDEVLLRVRLPLTAAGQVFETTVQLSNPTGAGFVVRFLPLSEAPLRPLTDYEQRVATLRRRGLVYPYELVSMLTAARDGEQGEFPAGEFTEYDLDDSGALVPVARPPGLNSASIVVGVLRNIMPTHPEGMARVALLGDPSKGLGSLAEPECRRIMAALDLADRLRTPLEWFALSSGAKIALDSGTENMDWIATVLRRIVHFTQAGGEINVVVTGINVGAQPYWNAEATMLMHTRGILVMTPESAMVLTGKQALEYSGGVSAEDNQGIGGYERVMGPNGQAQYWAPDIAGACHILLRHYEHTYVAPGERFPRRAVTTDPPDRDIRGYSHEGPEFSVVGDVFDEATNPARKHPFDIRSVMLATIDQDHPPLERWAGFRHAESAVVWDAHLGGWPVCLIGLESRPLARWGFVPADGPDRWTSGTLFPLTSKKVARTLNAASNNRPVIVLANLAGFDGSPESMRNLQLEYGAEIGRAVVNFRGPLVFCVVSRYHGGAFVVFSAALNDDLEVVALEGSFASVIGGAPAAAVVFAREVDARATADERVAALRRRLADADGAEKTQLRAREAAFYSAVRSEKLGDVAREFDGVHSIERARAVGSVHRIIPAAQLRPDLVAAVERGIERSLGHLAATTGSRPPTTR